MTPAATVTVPARPDSVRVLRVMVANAAAGADLGFDRYSDLELAVTEASALLLLTDPRGLVCRIQYEPGAVDVEMSGPGAAREVDEHDELSILVLEGVTDRFAVTAAQGASTVTFRVSGG